MKFVSATAATAVLVAGIVMGGVAAISWIATPAAAQSTDCRISGDNAGQIKRCTEVIANKRTSMNDRGIAYLYRCQAHDFGKQFTFALADCLTAADLNPDDSSVHNSLNIVYRNLGRLEESVDAASTAIKMTDGTKGAHFAGRAASLCKLGRVDQSVRDRVKAIELGYLGVEQVQSFLSNQGFYSGSPDGVMNRRTREALRAWTKSGC